jgi:predicted NAD/FAD-dependent oxidoreductase
LLAARELQAAGLKVLVLDKGRGPGGRMATRRIEGFTFDHGAQFMTARSPRFLKAIQSWETSGVVKTWFHSLGGRADGHPRWRGIPAMNALPKHLAQGLSLMQETKAVSLSASNGRWLIGTDTGEFISAAKVLLTAPIPQSLDLIDAGGLQVEPDLRQRLSAIEYERCLAVLAILKKPSLLPAPGAIAPVDEAISWIADNQLKGVSDHPCVTIHATPAFSLRHWDSDRQTSGWRLLEAAKRWVGEMPVSFQIHGWRFSKPQSVAPQACAIVSHQPLLVLAGDAFSGPKVEGAALSGWAAAERILQHPA